MLKSYKAHMLGLIAVIYDRESWLVAVGLLVVEGWVAVDLEDWAPM